MEEFARRSRLLFEGRLVFVTTPEDAVISKLEWAKIGESHRQIEDVRRLIQFRKDSLDRNYIEKWITNLGLEEQWNSVIKSDEAERSGADDRT